MMLAVVLKYVSTVDDVSVELLHLNFGQKGSKRLEEHVSRFAEELELPLRIWRFEEEWGMSFDELVQRVGGNPCSICSTLLRYYLLWFGKEYDVVATGHNLDDMVSFYLYNTMTGNTRFSSTLRPVVRTSVGPLKVRPFFYVPEERIAEEARSRGIVSFPTGCPSEEEAPTVRIRRYLKELESSVPGARKNLLRFFLSVTPPPQEKELNRCEICGMPTSGRICSVCRMKIKAGVLPRKDAQ